MPQENQQVTYGEAKTIMKEKQRRRWLLQHPSYRPNDGYYSSHQRVKRSREKLCRYISHFEFLSKCKHKNVIPKGMNLSFGKSALSKTEYLHFSVDKILGDANRDILSTCCASYATLIDSERENQDYFLYEIF